MSEAGPSSERVRIAVVILNYRTPKLVTDCLESLAPEMDPARDVAVVVDNESGDGSSEAIRAWIETKGNGAMRVVDAGENGGFAAGNNAGIRAVDAEAYLLLNSDTLVRPGAVETLWRAHRADRARGLVAPRLEWPDGQAQISCFRDHSVWSELMRGAATGPLDRLLSRHVVAIDVRDEPFAPEWVSFAAVLVPRATIERVGLLDRSFFMYFEDADYGRRVREAGLAIWYEPAARVVHLRGKSSPVKSLTKARKRRPTYFYESRSLYFKHRYGPGGRLAANLFWTAGYAIALVRELLGKPDGPSVEHELRDTWKH